MKNRKKSPENRQFGTETETGGFGTGTVTAKHPRGSVPVHQFPKSEPAVPNRNHRFLNRGHLYIRQDLPKSCQNYNFYHACNSPICQVKPLLFNTTIQI